MCRMEKYIGQQQLEALQQLVPKNQIFLQEPLAKHTTFRVGGPAEVLIQPSVGQVADIVAWCRKEKIPYLVIGNGSNLLVSDQGLPGVVLEMGMPASEIVVDGTSICAQAGASLGRVARVAAEASLTGMEFAGGIPGTIGGAVYMNAGAYGGEMSQIIESVQVLTPQGNVVELSVTELDLGYRHSIVEEKGYVVLSVKLQLESGEQDSILAYMEELRQRRIDKQPLEYPSAGSTFKRPEGYFAGKLIMDAGLAGYQVGGAQVSEKHCGFVINKEHATAADVMQLMEDVTDIVQKKYGVTLEPEVRRLGEFS